jgi:hypothetical protein
MCALFACVSVQATAATIRVRQDGSGNYRTLAAAIAEAYSGDQIEVGPGTYGDALPAISKDLFIYSISGPDLTILDGRQLQRIMRVDAGTVAVSGFRFYHGRIDAGENGQGGAAAIDGGSNVKFDDCQFVDNESSWDAGAIFAFQSNTEISLSNCRFEHNSASYNGGALGISRNAHATITDCTFVDNDSYLCGGVAVYLATVQMERCLFAGNAGYGIGAYRAYNSSSTLVNNTFSDNSSQTNASLLFDHGGTVKLSNNIIAGDRIGYGAEFDADLVARTCNIYFGNKLGSILGGTLEPTEKEAEPLFCDWRAGDYFICANSPAAPGQNDCGLVGAYPTGCACGPIRTESATWGSVKHLYH